LEIRHWLGREAPGLVEAFTAAVEVADSPPSAGGGQLIAHSIRDMVNRLPDELAGRRAERFECHGRVKAARAAWAGANLPLGRPAGGDAPSPGRTLEVPDEAVRAIQTLFSEYVESRPLEKARRMFAAVLPVGFADSARPVFDQWMRLRRWAEGTAHFNGRAPRETPLSECLKMLAILESSLRAFSAPFFAISDKLDEILEDAHS
jgi:hypothetical protein